jgi:hypothetical protein
MRGSGEEKSRRNLDRPSRETRGERSEFRGKSRNPVDRWIHTLKSRRSLTRLPISEFGDLNDEESWGHCISNSRVSKPRKDPYRWIRGSLRPSISLWGGELWRPRKFWGFEWGKVEVMYRDSPNREKPIRVT